MLQYLASGRISHIFYVGDGSDFGVSSPAEWRSMLSRCFDLSPCTRSSPLEYRLYFYELTSWIRVMMWGFFVPQVDGEHVAGAAKRRRERRHRAYLKYARMSVALDLSEYKHHASRGQRMDRAGRWERAALHAQNGPLSMGAPWERRSTVDTFFTGGFGRISTFSVLR